MASGNFRKVEANKFSSGKLQNKREIANGSGNTSRNSSGKNLCTENQNYMPGYTRFENRVRISLNSSSRSSIKELTMKLKGELHKVRSFVKNFEAQELQISGYFGGNGHNQSQFSGNNLVEKVGSSLKVGSEVGSAELPDSRLVRSVSVAENFAEFAEKETLMMPKTVKHCSKKELIPGKKFRPSSCESNGGKTGLIFKSCSNLLDKLMKHKHGWVFNVPVDAKLLGLHDYHKIITKPMDLGTVKARLNKNWYKSPREFAEDVRLTFSNAMTYNPKGEDAHVMAEQLYKIFEEKWAVIESKQQVGKAFRKDDGSVQPTPTSRKSPALATPVESRGISRSESMTKPLPANRATLGRSDLVTKSSNSIQKSPNFAHPDRLPVSKKPKAKNHENRDMTFEEKQRLSIDLQNLPSEKLNNVVTIIKKRNQGLFQNDDEIELDIASVDSETLWELDMFVANYKKSLIKNKRKAEDNLQSGEISRHSPKGTDVAMTTAAEEPVGGNADSESDSSSSCELDANQSPSSLN